MPMAVLPLLLAGADVLHLGVLLRGCGGAIMSSLPSSPPWKWASWGSAAPAVGGGPEGGMWMLTDRRRGAAAGSSALVASASEAGARCDRSGPWATAAVAVALLSLLAARTALTVLP